MQLLKSQAFLNLRNAQAIMRLTEKFSENQLNKVAAEILHQKLPLNVESFKQKLLKKDQPEKSLMGPKSEAFVRQPDYFSKQ